MIQPARGLLRSMRPALADDPIDPSDTTRVLTICWRRVLIPLPKLSDGGVGFAFLELARCD